MVGTAPDDTDVSLDGSKMQPGCVPSSGSSDLLVMCSATVNGTLRFALAYSKNSSQQATALAQSGLNLNLQPIIQARLAQYALTPRSTKQVLLNKAVSIMRVNALAKEGEILQRWSTPGTHNTVFNNLSLVDRVPHQYMWLWDSAFHSMVRG